MSDRALVRPVDTAKSLVDHQTAADQGAFVTDEHSHDKTDADERVEDLDVTEEDLEDVRGGFGTQFNKCAAAEVNKCAPSSGFLKCAPDAGQFGGGTLGG
jgi:hypothetical protein